MQAKLIKVPNEEVQNLYEQCFPDNERVPYAELFTGAYQNYQLYAFYQKLELTGLAHFITKKEFVHLNYLAVNPKYRNQGIGSQILTWLKQQYPNHAIVADVEIPDGRVANQQERINRINFYHKNGFIENNLEFDWAGETITPLSSAPLPTEQFIKQLKTVAPDVKNFRSRALLKKFPCEKEL